MHWFTKFYLLMDKGGEGGAGGGGSAGGGKGGEGGGAGDGHVTMSKEQFDSLMARFDKLEKGQGGKGGEGGEGGGAGDPDLADKAAKKREADEKAKADTKRLEAAVQFIYGAKDWLKTNAPLLPKTIQGIFDQAEKENYGSTAEKEQAIKVGIISEFFSTQDNLDLLTASQKVAIENFKKLTKTDKHERVVEIYDTIFEPTFETLKKVKRAEEVGRGHSTPSDVAAAYKDRLIKGSRKHYLGEKQ